MLKGPGQTLTLQNERGEILEKVHSKQTYCDRDFISLVVLDLTKIF